MDQMHTCGGNTAWQSYSKAYQLNLTFTFTNEETISGLEFVQYASYDLSSGRYKITNVTMFAGETRHAQEQPNSGAWIVTFPVVTAQVFTLELHSDSEGKFVLDCVKFRCTRLPFFVSRELVEMGMETTNARVLQLFILYTERPSRARPSPEVKLPYSR